MIQLIASIIFTISAAGIAFILLKKVPVLIHLPRNGSSGIKKHTLLLKMENKIKDFHFHFFSKQMLLHRLLSKFRILTLKLERKIDTLLHGIRTKAQELDKKVKNKK